MAKFNSIRMNYFAKSSSYNDTSSISLEIIATFELHDDVPEEN